MSRNPLSGHNLFSKASNLQGQFIQVPTTPTILRLLTQVTRRLRRPGKAEHRSHMISQNILSAVQVSNRLPDLMVISKRPLGVTIRNRLRGIHLYIHHQLPPSHKLEIKI